MRPARPCLAVALLVLGPVLTGCGDGSADGTTAWPTGGGRLEARGLVWAAGSTVHLGDGATLDVGTPIRSFVAAPSGVYSVPDDDSPGYAELRRTTPEGTEGLGVHPDPDSLALSPDGRYLALLDQGEETDGYGTHVLETVVVDLTRGVEVARTSAGMGDAGTDDLADLYEDASPGILGVDSGHAYVATTGDLRSIALDSGEVEVIGDHSGDALTQPWYDDLARELLPDSPGGDWSLQPVRDGQTTPPRLVGADGTTVTARLDAPGLQSWSLDSWLDADTAVGSAVLGDGPLGEQTLVLVTCALPAGSCAVVDGTEDGALLPAGRRVVVPTPLEGTP